MKLNDYVIAVVNCGITRLCSVKAKNPYHAVVKALVNLYNEECENDLHTLPIDGNLLYEKFSEKRRNLTDLTIDIFISKFIEEFVEFSDCVVSAIMEDGEEIYNIGE